MKLATFVRSRQWVPVLGYLFFIAALCAGYYNNLTFVQLGTVDLGVNRIGMRRDTVSVAMAALALVTLFAAVTATDLLIGR